MGEHHVMWGSMSCGGTEIRAHWRRRMAHTDQMRGCIRNGARKNTVGISRRIKSEYEDLDHWFARGMRL